MDKERLKKAFQVYDARMRDLHAQRTKINAMEYQTQMALDIEIAKATNDIEKKPPFIKRLKDKIAKFYGFTSDMGNGGNFGT